MSIKIIDPATLKYWIANDEVILVDVREPMEHNAEKIKGAILVPLSAIAKRTIPNSAGKKLVIHSQAGKRSSSAKLLTEDPNLEIYNLEGGMSAWKAAGNESVSVGKFFLPLDCQVQLTIGFCVLAGSLLTHFLNPLFFYCQGFSGLMFAGLSGICVMANILRRMPWNKALSRRQHHS